MGKMPVFAIVAILGVLAVGGCIQVGNIDISPAGTTATNSTSSDVRDPQLVQYLEVYNQTIHQLHPNNLTVYRVTWNNGSTPQIEMAFTYRPAGSNTTNIRFSDNVTVTRFSSVAEAAQYADSRSSGTNVILDFPTNIPSAYTSMTGRAPLVYSYYDVQPASGKPGRLVIQLDEYVLTGLYSFSPPVTPPQNALMASF